MKQLKHIDDNLYLVDTEAEIKVGDAFICPVGDYLEIKKSPFDLNNPEYHKIIAQLKNQLSEVPLFTLPDEKVDVEKLAYNECDGYGKEFSAFIQGYNRCLSDNKERKYTEADIRTAFMHGCKSERQLKPRFNCLEDYIQSITTTNLQQYDGKEVEIEYDTKFDGLFFKKTPDGKITITKIL